MLETKIPMRIFTDAILKTNMNKGLDQDPTSTDLSSILGEEQGSSDACTPSSATFRQLSGRLHQLFIRW